jgi:hypothetical protein
MRVGFLSALRRLSATKARILVGRFGTASSPIFAGGEAGGRPYGRRNRFLGTFIAGAHSFPLRSWIPSFLRSARSDSEQFCSDRSYLP